MTTFGAYEAGLPCKNTSCKSHGKPHPNCKCWAGMADGGEVKNYCSSNQSHRRDCKYFKDGGEVHPLDIPQHDNHNDSVAAYLAHGGLHGLVKMRAENPQQDLDKYNSAVHHGGRNFDCSVESLFGGDKPSAKDLTKSKEFLDSWISNGGINNDIRQEIYNQNSPQQSFARGGEVKSSEGILHQNHISNAYPTQNVMLQEAKGSASNYLSSLKPQPHQPKLAFDDAPDDTKQKKSYDSALHIAAHPLSVLEEIRKGTVEPEHIAHLKGMYPGLHDVMQQKVTKRITEAQLKDEKPPRHVRQGLSMFLGTPLSGELSPQSMVAAQAVFQNQRAAQQQGGQPQKKISAIAKSSQSYLLPNQAAAERQQKQ